jgi:hypothetical protein
MKGILTFYFFAFSIVVFSQNGQLRGHVTFLEDSSNLAGLNMYLIKEGKEIDTTFSDPIGNYLFKKVPTGTYDLKTSYVGFRDKLILNIFIADSLQTLNFVFPDQVNNIQRVCPYGDKDNIIPVIHEFANKKLMKKREKGELIFGEEVKNSYSPDYYCTKHKILF